MRLQFSNQTPSTSIFSPTSKRCMHRPLLAQQMSSQRESEFLNRFCFSLLKRSSGLKLGSNRYFFILINLSRFTHTFLRSFWHSLDSALVAAVFVALAGLLGVVFGVYLVQHFQRKNLLIVSALGTSLAFFALGVLFEAKKGEHWLRGPNDDYWLVSGAYQKWATDQFHHRISKSFHPSPLSWCMIWDQGR